MTHPLTPREKVARAIQAHDNDYVPDGYANGLSDEVSDWSAYLADRVLTALSSGSGDHAELARELRKHQHRPVGSLRIDMSDVRTILATFAAHDALIAEVAALRGANTEAERKLAEAVGLLREWMGTWFVDADSRGENAIADDTRKFLSKEAERG